MDHWAKMGSYTWGAAQCKLQSSAFTVFVDQKNARMQQNVSE